MRTDQDLINNVNDLERLLKSLEMKGLDKIQNIIFYNFLENLYSSTTLIHTPNKSIQFWFQLYFFFP